ncbi:tRNA (mnm(5)s(2)U34)-methyltransferase [Paenibacillus sanguinis]|uniref:tRNA (mnm(5)s(2)U34)-methyltransferase n=1 Tax=Paenibacillus sanguinis TaxID=225906 RepID=UPI000370DBB9|nr:class I SAM-dependent methyltransferase [Paenibacillus sanguinis]
MGFLSVLSFAHKLVRERIAPGDIAVDATAGTGADTLFLAKACGGKGQVFSFDIQQQALTLTQDRLTKEDASLIAEVMLLNASHARMEQELPINVHGQVAAVMFNLGYLPAEGADPALITVPDSTIPALEAGLRLLRPRGVLTAVLYPGHPGGELEAAAVENWAKALPAARGQSIIYRQLQRPAAPYLIAVDRK